MLFASHRAHSILFVLLFRSRSFSLAAALLLFTRAESRERIGIGTNVLKRNLSLARACASRILVYSAHERKIKYKYITRQGKERGKSFLLVPNRDAKHAEKVGKLCGIPSSN